MICANPACSRTIWKARLCCRCYFHRRRHGELPDEAEIERLEIKQEWREFYKRLDGYRLLGSGTR